MPSEQTIAPTQAPRLGLWAWLREKLDLASYRPQALPEIAISEVRDGGEAHFVIKSPAGAYYRLTPHDHFLWKLMDGTMTVKELVVAYFMEYGTFAFSRVANLVTMLRANRFLVDQPVNVYSAIRGRLDKRTPRGRLSHAWRAVAQAPLAISGVDGIFTQLYRKGGRLLFTRPAQILYILISLVGLVLFARLFSSGRYSVVSAAGSVGLGLALLLVAQFLSVLLHELAHGLTVKHYGREVRKAGMLFMFGLPAFFVDTTDIWLENRRARLAVTWAGPYSGLVLAGLATLAILAWPDFALNPLLFRFAFLTYLLVFFNLNPLLELDGYYLLMDWLRIPMLRRKSFAFLREGLPAKWRAGYASGKGPLAGFRALASLSREERIFTVFGVLAAAWTAYAIYVGLAFWQGRLASSITGLWRGGSGPGRVLLTVLVVLVGLLFLSALAIVPYQLLRGLFRAAEKRGAFETTGHVALWAAAGALALSIVAFAAGRPEVWPILALTALIAAAILAEVGARNFAGSHMRVFFRLFGAAMLAFLAAAVLQEISLLTGTPITTSAVQAIFEIAGYALLVATAIILLAHSDLRALYLSEKAGLGIGLVASAALTAWQVAMPRMPAGSTWDFALAVAGRLGPVLALTLLGPTIASFWATAFGPAWALLGLGLVGLLVLPLAGLPLAPAFMVFATGLGIHHIAFMAPGRGRLSMPPLPTSTGPITDDRESLRRVFYQVASGMCEQLRQTAGEREAGARIAKFNLLAGRAGWRVCIAPQEAAKEIFVAVEDEALSAESLIEQGRRYAGALNLLIDVTAAETGEKLAIRSFRRAYDGLPWEAREVAARYLFPDVRRANTLSQQFESLRSQYRALVQRMPLFATMNATEVDLLASRLRAERVPAGHVIIRQGDKGDKFYILSEGHVEVTVREDNGVTEVVRQLDRGAYFGELALLHDAPRNATCRATLPSEVLSLSRNDFDALVRDRFALREKIDSAVKRVELLRNIPLFSDMDAGQLEEIAAALDERVYEEDEILIRQGDVGDTFFIIEAGRAMVSVTKDGAERVIADRRPGEYVGEIALLMKAPRTATVRAVQPTRVLTLHRDDFDRLVAGQLAARQGLAQEASRRLRTT